MPRISSASSLNATHLYIHRIVGLPLVLWYLQGHSSLWSLHTQYEYRSRILLIFPKMRKRAGRKQKQAPLSLTPSLGALPQIPSRSCLRRWAWKAPPLLVDLTSRLDFAAMMLTMHSSEKYCKCLDDDADPSTFLIAL